MEEEGGATTEIRSPQLFGEYEVIKSIGKGKFAVVYRARKLGSEEAVALKKISVDMMDSKAREKCLKEVRLLQSLDHPNIIHYLDSFITENDLVIVYEWAAAGDLKRQLRKAQERGSGFEERIIWKYFSQISNAMQHMHERRIMHRDLKPANIFLTLDGTIKVGDLGLSRELSEHTVQAHSKVGTPLYMSPEVLKGDGYDFKSDIWSMGCLLYELAMLKSPFKSEGLNLYSLFQKISNGDYQPLPEHYSEDLRSLVYAMISTRPEERPELAYICTVAADMRAKYTEKYNLQKKTRSNSISEAKASQEESKTLENTVNIGDEKMDHIVNIVNKSRDVKNCNSEENVAVDEKDSAEEKKQDIGHDTYLPSRPIGDVKSTIFDENKNKPVNSYRRPRANNASNGYAKAGSTGHTEAIRRQNTELTVTNTIVGNNVDRENFEKQIHGSSVAFALMEVLYTKLVILGYPLDDPDRKGDKVGVDRIGRNKLLPFHFACNLQAFSGVAGHDNNHQFFQFRRMVQIVQWLCRKIGDASSLTIETFNLDEDSPITTAKQILRAVNVTTMKPVYDFSSVSPTSLTLGYGENVCNVLLHFADCALHAINYESVPLVRSSFDETENERAADETSDVDPEESVEDGVENDKDSIAGTGTGTDDALAQSNYSVGGLGLSILLPSIDPDKWKEETERVAPLLNNLRKINEISFLTEWSSHVELMQKYVKDNILEDCAYQEAVSNSSASSIKIMLRAVNIELREVLKKISSAERTLQGKNSFDSLFLDYEVCTKELESLIERTRLCQEKLQMVSSTYAEIDEKYHDTKEALEALSGNKDDKSSGSSSSNAVVRIKEAIRQLKDDISNANVSVHLLSNTLLNIQVRNTKEKQLLNVQKRLRKHVEPSLLEG